VKAKRPNFPSFDDKALKEKDKQHVLHPWQDIATAREADSFVVAEAEDVFVYDATGERFIDGIGGMWCVNIGYGRDEMAEAIAEQARRMPYYSPFGQLTSPPAAELGARLASYAPGDLNEVFFSTGGSTANDSAVRFVQFYFNSTGRPNKKHIISRLDSYHGSTYLAASLTGKMGDRGNFDYITDTIHHIPSPNPYRRPEGMSLEEFCAAKVADLENEILRLGPDNVGCFIAEPILASGGVIVPPPGYHAATLEVCRKYDVIYISDEVVTGFGRLGQIFASEAEYGIVPDILTCAKGLTSGYVPLGATLIADHLLEPLMAGRVKDAVFTNGFTYSGHPVSCAAALKNLEIIEREGILEHVRRVGPYFQEKLRALSDLAIVGDVRGSHLMAGIECVADKATKVPLAPEIGVGKRIDAHCQRRGLILRPIGHLCVLSPPLTIREPEIDRIAAIIGESIEATMAELRAEGLWHG